MDAAEKIGLLPGFGWLAGHNLLITLIICLLITPGMMYVIGIIGESRLLPSSPNYQFISFMPGDLFLSLMTALLLWWAQRLPAEEYWYNAAWWHVLVLLVALAVAVMMTLGEYNSGAYPKRAILSPTKLYHNIVLYGFYGYVIAVVLVAVLASSSTRQWPLVVILIPGLIWVVILTVIEPRASDQVKAQRTKYAHTPDWLPVWSRS